MSQTRTTCWTRCFLCRRKAVVKKNITAGFCPASKKSLEEVLQHLARLGKTELHISRDESLCINCHTAIIEYDAHLLKLLRKQRNLTQLVEKAAISVDDNYEEDCDTHMSTMEEINDDHYFDDCNVSDNEISETVNEAINGNGGRKKHSRSEYQYDYKTTSSSYHERSPRELIQCTLCAMRFKSQGRLQKHTAQAHKKFSCEVCNFSHRNEDYVLLHMNVHLGRNENQCRFCDKDFTTKISTIRHMEVHLDSKKYQCDKCGLCFSQTTVLYNHKLQHEAEEQPLHCEICNQVFKTKRTYRHHMITHRADRPRYSCEFCAKTFTEKYTLKVHKRTHPEAATSVTVPPVDQMQQQSTTEQQQQQPQQMQITTLDTNTHIASAEARFNCIICDLPFPNKDHLNKHMEREHDVITKSLTLTNFSQYEVVTHEPKTPCHICGHMFRTKTNLNYHLENMHGVALK